ncbi:hypothetical protein TTHERM_00822330 (macronuclear) [Tetrahymena thermophila SB210]|uniref:Uncharacterized protein n=1 Tax=Tetrahymena thermophila (strain SB210) TaxID=312017 RepID=Q22EY2_TETTS|nr:hypothetical protein TTHERM_00822330 [Tetrahymena thermophila SB210]EAR83893.2 hypothetical protein TTHERM_00822330 [Tetrahymena thermophila SB210]|eukprot:XP_001031556.2 hypothetical protein TTHERM_00822330 [Tetrahymena thermophila SB210]
MNKNKSFETLQQLDLIRNRYHSDISLIIEDLIDLIQLETEQLYNSQNKVDIEQQEQENQSKLQQKIEHLVSKVDEQCQTYAKQVIDYIFQINSTNISLLEVQLKNVLISIKSFVKKPQNKTFVTKLKAQVVSDLMKVQSVDNSIQYYDEVKKSDNNQQQGSQKKKKKNYKEEGFISSESENSDTDQSEQQGKNLRKRIDNDHLEEVKMVEDQQKMSEDDQESPFKLKQIIKNLEKQVLELKEKVVNRECILSEITYGYMKDVSHWKEIFNRKDRDFQNCFEVSYFEPSIIYDDKIREVLNSRLQDLKLQCENKMYQMQKKFKRHQEEFEKLQETLFAFMSQNDPISVAKTLFAMEQNPHKIWRILQDQMGNTYFFRIFEQQKAGYGIRYKEIDELISQSKASSREYEEFKRQIKHQMEKMVERSQQEIESIRKEVAEKEKEIEQIRKGFSQDLENVRQETIKQMEEQFKVREENLYQEFEERRKDIYEQLGNRNFERIIEESQLKLFFQKWMFAAKLMKVKQSLDQQEEESMEKKQDFLKKYILRQLTQPQQQSKKVVEIPGSLFQSKRLKAKVSQRHSIISIQQRARLQSYQQDEFSDNLNDQSQRDPSLLSSKITQKLEKKPSENFKIDRKPSFLQEKSQLDYSEKKMVESQVTINDQISEKEKVKEEINNLLNEDQGVEKQGVLQEEDIDQIFELEMQIDSLKQQIQEQQNQKSGLEERISFLNKQVERVTQELHCQRDFNTQFKNDNRELKLKITLYEDTFNEIAQKIGFQDLKIQDIGDPQSKKAKNFMKAISNSNKQEQNGFILALETQQTKNEAADIMLGEKYKEKGTSTKIQGINETLSHLEQQQKEIEIQLEADSLDQENAIVNARERIKSNGQILEDKETQTDLEMKDVDFKTKKRLKRSADNSPNPQKAAKKKEKSIFDKFDVDEIEKNSSTNINKNLNNINQLESPQFMKQRYKLNGQDKVEQDSSDEEKKNYHKRNSVWERLFNDQFDRKKREEELKKQLESIEEKHWQEILKILNLYSQQKFDTENELIRPFFPKYAPKKKQQYQQINEKEQKRCYTPNIELNKVRNNSSNKETLLNQSSTFNVMQEQKTPPSQQATIGLQKIKTRADYFYKKLQTEPSQMDIQSNNIYLLSSNGKERNINELSNNKQEQHIDSQIKTSPFEYFANIYNKQHKKQNAESQLKNQIQFLQKYPQLDKTFNQPIFPISSIPSSNSKQQQAQRNRSYSINRQKNNSMSDKKESFNQSGALNKSINQNINLAPSHQTFYQTQNSFYYSKYPQMAGKKAKLETQKQNILPNS